LSTRKDFELLHETLGAEPARDREPWRVVGQHDVLVAERSGGHGHLLDGAAAVGPV